MKSWNTTHGDVPDYLIDEAQVSNAEFDVS